VVPRKATDEGEGEGNLYSFQVPSTELGLRSHLPNSEYEPKTP